MKRTILANAEIVKLREYSRSYGQPETIKSSFLIEYENTIDLIDSYGNVMRTMRIGGKLLLSYSGKEITERAFKIRTGNAKQLLKIAKEKDKEISEKNQIEILKKVLEQKETLKKCFVKNPEFKNRIKNTIENNSSKYWRNVVKMKVCQKIAGGNFKNLHITPADIREVAFL